MRQYLIICSFQIVEKRKLYVYVFWIENKMIWITKKHLEATNRSMYYTNRQSLSVKISKSIEWGFVKDQTSSSWNVQKKPNKPNQIHRYYLLFKIRELMQIKRVVSGLCLKFNNLLVGKSDVWEMHKSRQKRKFEIDKSSCLFTFIDYVLYSMNDS